MICLFLILTCLLWATGKKKAEDFFPFSFWQQLVLESWGWIKLLKLSRYHMIFNNPHFSFFTSLKISVHLMMHTWNQWQLTTSSGSHLTAAWWNIAQSVGLCWVASICYVCLIITFFPLLKILLFTEQKTKPIFVKSSLRCASWYSWCLLCRTTKLQKTHHRKVRTHRTSSNPRLNRY